MDQQTDSWIARYVGSGIAAGDDERSRLRKRSLTMVVSLVCLLSPAWIGTYLALDRPIAAFIPAAYVVLSLVGMLWLFITKRDREFVASQVVAMAVLPFALQWALGGFVHGSAVALWAFASVLVALVSWGVRAAFVAFAAFMVGMAISGVAEASLRAAVPPLPPGVTTAFFVLDVTAPLATAFVLLVYFNRERDSALRVADSLLVNILPASVVQQLKSGRQRIADARDEATVIFLDFVGFTAFAERSTADAVVEVLERAFLVLDGLATRHRVEKIKTLGDGYLAAAGVTDTAADHASAVADMALAAGPALQESLRDLWPTMSIRIGIATGPVVAGVIGERRLGFDLWGDTVNTASRMATSAEPGTIQITEATARALEGAYAVEARGAIDIKGKGSMRTHVLRAQRHAGV